MSIKRLVVIVGPTASGKTSLSIELARRFNAPILSADSRQLYRGMRIGTAQPTDAQLRAAEHHFIACLDVEQNFNCGEYEKQALQLLDTLFVKFDTVIAVGGSGLYIKALCEGMDDLPEADDDIRNQLAERLAAEELSSLVAQLRELDCEYCEYADLNNPARVMRALEVCLVTGRKYSSFRSGERKIRNFDIVKIGVNLPRAELYDRINNRVDDMIAEGLLDEVKTLLPYRHLNALNTVGYSELFDWIDGKTTYDEAVELLKRNTRRYAKRQITWFGRDKEIRWFAPAEVDAIVEYIESL